MTDVPCWDCIHKRKLYNTGNSLSETLGIFVCIEDTSDAFVIDKSIQNYLNIRGCNKKVKK